MTESPTEAPAPSGWAARAWAWLKEWGGVLFGAIAAVLVLAIGGGWLWQRKQRELGAVKDELAVVEAQRDIAALTSRRDALIEQSDAKDPRVAEIDRDLAANRRRVIEAHENAEGMSDREVEDAFAGLGY